MARDEALARLARAEWLAEAQPFFACLEGAEGLTRAVGGIVRDTLLGIPRSQTDIDLATVLMPQTVMARAESAGLKAHPTGIAHGTVTLVHEGRVAEVTTLRADVETFGRHASVRFGSDWEEDARRRDFTMNALYCGMDGVLFDPLGGLEDCLAGRVRFIGDPDSRIAEDRLRVYRYFRFCASHGDQRFDDAALAACRRAAGTVDALSGERVGSEMMRLLSQPRCAATLGAMRETGILPELIFSSAALAALERVEGFPAHVSAHARLAVAEVMGLSVEDLKAGWRLSNADMDAIGGIAAAAGLAREGRWGELAYRYPSGAEAGIAVAGAVEGKTGQWVMEASERVRGIVPGAFPLSGRELMAAGYTSGPALGAELRRLETLWIESGFKFDRQALMERLRLPEGF